MSKQSKQSNLPLTIGVGAVLLVLWYATNNKGDQGK